MSKLKLSFLVIFCFISIITSLAPITQLSKAEGTLPFEPSKVQKLLDALSRENIIEHLNFLTSHGSRMTLYPGYEASIQYVKQKFSEYGLETTYQPFDVTVPIDEGAKISLLDFPDQNLSIYAMEPNLVVPVTANLQGALIYIGDGEPDDITNALEKYSINIEDSIALINYNSQNNWLKYAKYGGKAVIFIEPTDMYLEETEKKSIDAPFYFPRYYMKAQDAQKLLSIMDSLNEPVYVQLTSKMIWKKGTAQNIIGKIEGSTYPDQYVILSAYLDSDCVVPSLAEGANEATGLAALLELARILSMPEFQPKYTVYFVVFSGHHQYLAGARQFVEEYVWNYSTSGRLTDFASRLILQIHMQTSTENNYWATLSAGEYARSICNPPSDPVNYRALCDYIDTIVTDLSQTLNKPFRHEKIAGYYGTAYSTSGYLVAWPHLGSLMFDSEVLRVSGGPGFGFLTVDYGHYKRSPLDTYSNIKGKLENLWFQLDAIFPVIHTLLNTDSLQSKYLSSTSPKNYVDFSFHFSGKVGVWNISKAWYDPVPNAVFYLKNTWVMGRAKGIVLLTDENGRFDAYQITSGTGGPGTVWQIAAYVIDPETGHITYGPEFGYKQYSESSGLIIKNDRDIGFFTVFPCASVILFDVMDPYFALSESASSVFFLESKTDASPESFGHHIYYPVGQQRSPWVGPISVLYAPTEKPLGIFFNSKYYPNNPLGILINASEANPKGVGYSFNQGEQFVFTNTQLQVVKNMYYTVQGYITNLQRFGLAGDFPNRINSIKAMINNAENSLENNKFSEVDYYSTKSWSNLHQLYVDVRDTYVNIITTTPFFAGLLVPCVYLMERLFYAGSGPKRILALVLCFILVLAPLYVLHPGFAIASNSVMVVVGFMIIILVAPVLLILTGDFLSITKKLAETIKGKHIVEMGRTNVVMLSFSVGIENIKKRRLRSSLLFITIMLVVSALTLFSSVSAIKFLRGNEIEGTPLTAPTIYLRRPSWSEGTLGPTGRLGQYAIDYLKIEFRDSISFRPRIWIYTLSRNTEYIYFKAWHGDKYADIYALTALTSNEIDAVKDSVVNGTWFSVDEGRICIISTQMAKQLDANLGSEIQFLGKDWTIIGLVDPDIFDNIKELDTQPITPFDHRIQQQDDQHVSIVESVIIPYKEALHFRYDISELSATFEDKEVSDIVINVFKTFPMFKVYESYITESGIKTRLYSQAISYVSVGIQSQIIPICIACLMILNLMIASVKDRQRDIFVFSSVGMSPTHVGVMFLAEATIFAFVAVILGYFGAIITSTIVGWISPGAISLNYSSTWVAAVIVLTMVITVLSTIYPIYVASRSVTPSLERVWAPPTKPSGNLWEVPLPIFFSDQEIMGGVAYIIEWLQGHAVERAELFSINNLTYGKDDKGIQLKMEMDISPYERGITQLFSILWKREAKSGRWGVNLYMKRIGGRRQEWIRATMRVIDALRKQLLLWRSLSDEDVATYKRRAEKIEEELKQ